MEYLYENRKKFEDFASGRVLYNQAGTTSFPVRLASEIFLRCKAYLNNEGFQGPFTLFDPCCGGAYLLTVIGFLHGNDIKKIIASDINEKAIRLANKNLGLLTANGLRDRIKELKKIYETYQKDSHREAISSAEKLLKILESQPSIEISCTKKDALSINKKNNFLKIDMVIVDVPYGNLVSWSTGESDLSEKFMSSLRTMIMRDSIVAIISNKKQRFQSRLFKKVEKFKIGLRQVSILTPDQ